LDLQLKEFMYGMLTHPLGTYYGLRLSNLIKETTYLLTTARKLLTCYLFRLTQLTILRGNGNE